MLPGSPSRLQAHLLQARMLGLVKSMPDVSIDDIYDWCDDSIFVKLLSMTQALWMFAQLVERRMKDLRSSPLAATMIAATACAFVIDVLCFGRPQGPRLPITVTADRPAEPDDFKLILLTGHFDFNPSTSSRPSIASSCFGHRHRPYDLDDPDEPDDNLDYPCARYGGRVFKICVFAGMFIFGMAQTISGRLKPPIEAEHKIMTYAWASNTFGAASGVILVPIYACLQSRPLRQWCGISYDTLVVAWARLFLVAVLLARVMVIVLSVRGLYFLELSS